MKPKELTLIFILLSGLLIPAGIRAQINPFFKITGKTLGIPGLTSTNVFAFSPDHTKIMVSSSEKHCISYLKQDEATKDWYLFQNVFLDSLNATNSLDNQAAFSNDGKNLYVSFYSYGNRICNFSFDPGSDTLQLASVSPETDTVYYGTPNTLIVEPGGHYVYGVSYLSLMWFERDLLTGNLTFKDTLGLPGMADYDIRISPDGKNLYLISTDRYIRNYRINPSDGSLIPVETISYTPQNNILGLTYPNCLDLDKEGKYLYVASSELSIFSRNTTDGTLTFIANQGNLGKEDIINGYVRLIGSMFADKTSNNKVHLLSSRDGWILMDKVPGIDTLVYDRIVGEEGFTFTSDKRIISEDTNAYIINGGTSTLTRYEIEPDTCRKAQVLHAYQDAINYLTNLILSKDEKKFYASNMGRISVFDRNDTTGVLSFLGYVGCPGCSDYGSFCINSTGKNLYAGSTSVSVFRLTDGPDLPELIQEYQVKYAGQIILLSGDDKFLYAVSQNGTTIKLFSVDTAGMITYLNEIQPGFGISALCMSDDDRFVYAVSQSDHTFAVFSRDTSDGTLTEVQRLVSDNYQNYNLSYLYLIKISKDGRFIYTGSSERPICILARDSVTGQVTVSGSTGDDTYADIYRPRTLTFSNDSRYLYVTTEWWKNALTIFTRDTVTGSLTKLKTFREGDPQIQIGGPLKLINDSQDRFLYALGWDFITGYRIDPIMEDSLHRSQGSDVNVYSNPFYPGYAWSVSSLNQHTILTADTGWIYLHATDEYNLIRSDSVYIDTLSGSGLSKITGDQCFTVHPNPSDGIFSLSHAGKIKGKITMIVCDVRGNEVWKGSMMSPDECGNKIDISGKPRGIYFLKVVTENNSGILKLILR